VWAVAGPDASAHVQALKDAPGVQNVSAFGSTVHVAGTDAALLAQAVAPLRGVAGLQVAPAEANLEDVFISLIGRAQDNFARAPGP
jgi:ABC-2 type transport system ATP-binding protein